MSLDYEQIIEAGSRQETAELLKRLADPALPPEEAELVVRALSEGADPRAVDRLEEILGNLELDPAVRVRAATVHRELLWSESRVSEAALHWWRSSDPILQKHALAVLGYAGSDLVAGVAADSQHPLQHVALESMRFFYDEPRYETIKISALAHSDSRVREAAAGVLLWDEPVAAEEPLVVALEDDVPAVVEEVIHTLEYYPSQRILQALGAKLKTLEPPLVHEAECVFSALRERFLEEIRNCTGRARQYLRAWMAPVWSVLAPLEEEILYEPPAHGSPRLIPESRRETRSERWILQKLAQADMGTREIERVLRQTNWQAFSAVERKSIARSLGAHQDAFVRCEATAALTALGAADTLSGLLADDVFLVRKHAMYELGNVERSPEIAEVVLAYLDRDCVRSTHARESVRTYAHHASPGEAVPTLVRLASDERVSEDARVEATSHLVRLEATAELIGLLPLLEDKPLVTWAVHLALMDAATDLEIPRIPAQKLAEVDNLDVQLALARRAALEAR